MPKNPALLAIWGGLLLLFLAVKIYASRMSRNEDNQLILQDSSGILKAEQAAISGRLNRFKPVQMTATWAFIAMTLFVVGYYAFDMVSQFK